MTPSRKNNTIRTFIIEDNARQNNNSINSRGAAEISSTDIRQAECAKTVLILLFYLFIFYDSS